LTMLDAGAFTVSTSRRGLDWLLGDGAAARPAARERERGAARAARERVLKRRGQAGSRLEERFSRRSRDAKAPKIKPLGRTCFCVRLEAEEKTKGGIILPDTAKEKPKEGEVLALGEAAGQNGKRKDFQVNRATA